MLRKNPVGISACVLVALAGNAAASPCLSQPANAAVVVECGNEQPLVSPGEGAGSLRVKSLDEHQDKFGEVGKYGFSGPGKHDQPVHLETPAQPPVKKQGQDAN